MKRIFLLGSFVLLIDWLTKLLTYTKIPLIQSNSLWMSHREIPIFKDFFGIDFSLSHVANKGAAWGAFSEYQNYLLMLRIGLIIAMIVYLFFFNKNKNRILPLTLVISGAIGNVVDFFLYGHVIDMFHFVLWGYDFAVFNCADACITIGIGWLFLVTYFGTSPKKLKV